MGMLVNQPSVNATGRGLFKPHYPPNPYIGRARQECSATPEMRAKVLNFVGGKVTPLDDAWSEVRGHILACEACRTLAQNKQEDQIH